MIKVVLILAYVLNIFVNRWFNMLLYRNDKYNPIVPFFWFVPMPIMIFIYLVEVRRDKRNWFTGKNW